MTPTFAPLIEPSYGFATGAVSQKEGKRDGVPASFRYNIREEQFFGIAAFRAEKKRLLEWVKETAGPSYPILFDRMKIRRRTYELDGKDIGFHVVVYVKATHVITGWTP